jgi:hypothetical protein
MNASFNCALRVVRIYGILGIASMLISQKIRPQYSVSAEEVYQSTFLENSQLEQRLELLWASRLDCQQANTPSWVPNLTVRFNEHTSFAGLYSASEFNYRSPKILEVTGIRCSTIDKAEISLDNESDMLDVFQSIGEEKLRYGLYVTGESL